jgi:hypothetical protein
VSKKERFRRSGTGELYGYWYTALWVAGASVLLALAVPHATSGQQAIGDMTPGAAGSLLGSHEPMVDSESDVPLNAFWGQGCPPRWYVIGEAVALNREGDAGTTMSQAFRLPEFDFQFFGRLTVGHTRDCLDGWDIGYLGGGKWRNSAEVTGANDLNSRIVPGIDINPVDLATFNNAALHFQQYESELHTAEINRRWFGWDVMSMKVGVRWIRLDEEFFFRSVLSNGAEGIYNVDLQNDLILVQTGLDLMRPLGRLTYGGRASGGIGVNVNNGHFFVRNGAIPIVNNSSNSEEFAFFFDAGYFAYYRLTRGITLRVGYEGMFIGGLALAADQLRDPLTTASGLAFDEHGNIFVHGGSAGVEIVW